MKSTDVRLREFRAMVFAGIKKALAQDGHHKAYEGFIRYHRVLPDYFGETWDFRNHTLELSCYVLGPSRHYTWTGDTAAQVFAKATKDVKRWIRELEEEL